MKTKNVRVRVKDIKQGVQIFRSHPFFGVEEIQVKSRPYNSSLVGSLFAKSASKYGDDTFSLSDAGIMNGESYNDRRTFFKRKQAEEWAKKMKTDKAVIARHEAHLQRCKELDGFMRCF